MVTYMTTPINKLTLGATEYTNYLVSATVTRLENGLDSAVIVLPDTSIYPTTVTEGTTVLLEVKNTSDGSYTTLFVGTVRFVTADISATNSLTLHCRSIGFGLQEMLVAAEYGSQSINSSLDTITEIITDATNGIVPNYVQKILGGSNSNYAFDTTYVETITDSIPYIGFPYKPADKALNDLCDLVTAYKAGTAGPHWIITRSGATNYLRVKLVSGTQVGWTKYYGDSQANATLTYGTDYTQINIEKMSSESNYIVYYGAWRRPSNGDYWTESAISGGLWGNTTGSLADNTYYKVVGANSVLAYTTANPSGPIQVFYPAAKNAAWNFSGFTDFNTPNLNFYAYYDLTTTTTLRVRLYTDAANYYEVTLTPPNQKWQHYSIPVGPYYKAQGVNQDDSQIWSDGGTSPDWADINWIEYYVADAEKHDDVSSPIRYLFAVDGLHFGDASVCRVAALSSYVGVITKMRLIVDDIGKDDSLLASDDSGLMAKMAYAELLRQRTNSAVGTVTTPMIKDLLPGQWLYIQSTDYRATKLQHQISRDSYLTTIDFTSDVINGRSRPRYEDLNKQFASIRPEWQDRQASNMKAGSVDWRITRLVKTYA